MPNLSQKVSPDNDFGGRLRSDGAGRNADPARRSPGVGWSSIATAAIANHARVKRHEGPSAGGLAPQLPF